jgi:hypothetical protein
MRTIHKYALAIKGEQEIPMPKGATLLSVQEQRSWPILWAEVEDEADLVSRVIHCYGTGHPLPALLGPYIGTVLQHDIGLVWHFFDHGERAACEGASPEREA